jgi:hypothetical protein
MLMNVGGMLSVSQNPLQTRFQRAVRMTLNNGNARLGKARFLRVRSALNGVDFDGLDFHAEFLKPLDGALDFLSIAVEFEADEADLVVHARLT